MSTQRTIGYLPGLHRDAEGRALCRWCQKPVPKGRHSWCSQACVDEYMIRSSPASARAHVFQRDKGVCARCGADTGTLEAAIRDLRARWKRWRWADSPAAEGEELDEEWRKLCESSGVRYRPGWLKWGFSATHLWEAHHIVPVVEGGGECGLDGYETLCLRCHKAETAALAARRAKPKPPPAPPLPALFE
ncbi:MAG: HNH endonuclease [Thermaerobacter sp.]|nr:HNH endonuclease [Thermaerobacter sp.]